MAEPMLCIQCGAVTTPKQVTPGTWMITVVLLLFFVVPGIIYMLWRHSSSYAACRNCGAKNLVPVTSPFAQDLVATRPLVSASLATEKQSREDMRVGGLVLAVIIVLILIIGKISGCGS